MTKGQTTIPINTLEESLRLARALAPAISKREGNAYRIYRLFGAFTSNELEALAAFFIWRARGEVISELLHQR